MNNSTTPYNDYQSRPMQDEENIDFKRYLSLFISNWYWFAVFLFITVSIAYGINRWSDRLYTVTSALLIKDEQYGGGLTGIEKVIPGGDIFRSQQNLKNEIGILKSDSLNNIVMDSLPNFHVQYIGVGRRSIVETKMYKKCPVIVEYKSLGLQPQLGYIGIKITSNETYSIEIGNNPAKSMNFGDTIKEGGFDFVIKLRDKNNFRFNPGMSNKYKLYFISPENLASQYRSSLKVRPIEDESSLVILSITGYVPEQEADYLNELMDQYIQQGLDYKNKTAENTIKFINSQVEEISKSLLKAEDAMEEFRETNRFIDISKEGTIIQSKLESVESEKNVFDLQKIYYGYLIDYIKKRNESGEIISPSTFGIIDQYLIKLVNDLSDLQLKKRQLGFNIKNNIPAVALLDNEIENARKLLQENLNNSISQLDLSLKNVNNRLNIIETEVNKLPKTDRKLIELQRTFDLNNTVYTYLLEKKAEAGIAKASNVSDNRIIDRAFARNAVMIKPKKQQNYGLAFIIGILLPGLAILLIDFFNNKVIDKKDIEKLTTVPVIGYISHNDYRTEIPVNEKPGSTLAESFRSVRTALKYFIKESQHPVICITSTISAEGKTFVAVNLATSIATLGKKVLLVGLDLRKPRIHRVFNLDNTIGISSYLIGEKSINDVIQKTDIENLFYLPSGPVPPNPAELIDSEEMRFFIENVKEIYDYIIFDTPPIAIVTDALLLAPFTNVNIFVVRQRYSSKNTIGLIEELHQRGNLQKIGIIINDINLSGYYGYGLRYGYSVGYGYTYGYGYYGQYINNRYGYSDTDKGYYTED